MAESPWPHLLAHQQPRAAKVACASWKRGLEALGLSKERPPTLTNLQSLTDWTLVPTNGEVPSPEFLAMLARRTFPINGELRPIDELYASVDPDLWHEAFGHFPSLLDPQISRLYETFGRAALRSPEEAGRLFWHVAEYGLIEEEGETKVLGAGLLASPVGLERFLTGHVGVKTLTPESAATQGYDPHEFQADLYRIPSISAILELLERL